MDINTAKYNFYRQQGIASQHVNNMERAWLLAQGITSSHLNQMWFRYTGGLGFTGTLNDRLFKWLGSLGHTQGTLPERWLSYYKLNGGGGEQGDFSSNDFSDNDFLTD